MAQSMLIRCVMTGVKVQNITIQLLLRVTYCCTQLRRRRLNPSHGLNVRKLRLLISGFQQWQNNKVKVSNFQEQLSARVIHNDSLVQSSGFCYLSRYFPKMLVHGTMILLIDPRYFS